MDKTNGVLFPGGGQKYTQGEKFTDWMLSALEVLMYAFELNSKGTYPVWLTCQGFEAMNVILAGTDKVLDNSLNMFKPAGLQVEESAQNTTISRHFSIPFVRSLSEHNSTYNVHRNATTVKTWKQYPELDKFWEVIATSTDDAGQEVVTLTEAFDCPFFGTQFHVEKNLFDYQKLNIPHNDVARELSEELMFIFINAARENSASNDYESEVKDYIENDYHLFTSKKLSKDYYYFYH